MIRTAASLILASIASASAVILFNIDPINTAEPTAPGYAKSGWQYEGIWGGFLGTPIAPSFFVSAGHIGPASSALRFKGVDYPVVREYLLRLGVKGNGDPLNSDLVIWQITGTFPSFAPLYTKNDEIGKRLIVIGRGTERGDRVMLNGTPRGGWYWGTGFGIQRWGENKVSDIVAMGPQNNDGIYSLFDEGGLPYEAHLSNGDSGGAVFIEDGAVWKLAGINYAVDGPIYPGPSDASAFDAALYDARDFYYKDGGQFVQFTGDNPVPTGFYATRISARLDWIYSVIDPTGDLDADSIPNLLEHALKLNPLLPDAANLPSVAREGDFLTLTYRKNLAQGDLAYVVENSTDLVGWATAQTQDEIVSTVGDLQIIKAKVALASANQLFLRLRVTRP